MNKFSWKFVPVDIKKQLAFWNIFLFLSVLIQIIGWFLALFYIGADTDQGNVYRIIFVHVPVAWCAFFWVFLSAIFGILVLINPKKSAIFDRSSHAALELGATFALLTLITGSIWGHPTWGVWWDWDPRLTSSLVMFLVCCGYLILRYFTPDLQAKRNISAVLSILSAVNVPIVYYSVNLWRSLHQPQTFVESSKNASQDVTFVLFFNVFALFILSIALYKIRRQALSAQETLEQARNL